MMAAHVEPGASRSLPAVTTETRHFTASALVLDLERALVLLVDHKAAGCRQLPGGHVDPDETADQAALREVWEETGVHARLWPDPGRPPLAVPGGVWHPSPWMTCEFPAPAKPAKGEPAHSHIDMLFLATARSTDPVTARQAEVGAAVWVPVDGLESADVREDVPLVVSRAWRQMATRVLP